jgi:type IV secretory pathway VirB10-like protein
VSDRAVEARAARAAAYQAALEAPLFAPSAAAQTATLVRGAGSASPTFTEPAPAATPATAPGRPAEAMWGRHQAFMAEAARGGTRGVHTSVDSAPGPYALQEGTLIPAVFVTEVNSDLPGAVLAQVARDVYDSRTQRTVLIPAGSRLVGAYEHQLAVGQDRLLVAWTRVIFPDGRSITLPGLETKDAAGAGGVRDRVDRHTRQVFGTATLLSLVGAAVQLSQPNGGYGLLGAVPSAGQVAAGAAGQQLAQVATQMLQRNMDVQPTIRIRQGTTFNVFVSADLTFPAPYAAGP